MTEEEIRALMEEEIDCGQIVAQKYADKTGLSVSQLRKMASCYGAGMLRGETCGAVIAAYNIIGLLYGHDKEHDAMQKGEMLRRMLTFNELFGNEYSSFVCKDVMGADITTTEGNKKIAEGNLLMTRCPEVIHNVIKYLNQVLEEE